MAKFVYNNIKNASTSYIYFELNCGYHFYVFYEENNDLYSKTKSANELLIKL